jgi:uncharacterized lipoprotein
MRLLVKNLLLIFFLASCGTTEESRYRDTAELERPPIVTNNSPSREERTVDDSSIPRKKNTTGLDTDVYQNSALQLTIKQPFDTAWNTLSRAFKQSAIKVTDHERDKGLYYVTRDVTDPSTESTGFLAKVSSFFSNDTAVYLLTVEQEAEETKVTASVANATEQSSVAKKANPTSEGAEELLQLLFKTLRDELEEE